MNWLYGFFNAISEWWEDFLESDQYKIFISPLPALFAVVMGNTAGIWVGYVLIEFILEGIFPDLKWPGINPLINEGVFLIISFSFISTVIYESSKTKKINFFNVFGVALLLLVIAFYIRAVGLRQVQPTEEGNEFIPDKLVYGASLFSFFCSIILLYVFWVRGRYIELVGRQAIDGRGDAMQDLKNKANV